MQTAKYRTSPAENKVTVHFRQQMAMTKNLCPSDYQVAKRTEV